MNKVGLSAFQSCLRILTAFLPCAARLLRMSVLQAVKEKFGKEGAEAAKGIEWLTFKAADLDKTVRDDMKLLRDSPLIPDSIAIHGFVYDVSKL